MGISTYSDEVAAAICERLALGESLRRICADEDMPDKATVFRWLEGNEAFRDQYGRAREMQAETMVDDILEIADDTTQDTEYGESGPKPNSEWISRSKLRVDARLKLMGQLAPKKYGPKMSLTVAEANPVAQLTDEELLDEIRKLTPKQ